MASSGKKGKKNKGTTLALTEFLHKTPGETPTIPIRKSVKSNLNWADDVEDITDSYDSRPKSNVVLPTAPKASRGYDDFNEKIPHTPPFLAYLSNLPYEINENEIADFFANLRIASIRMPAPKDGEGQKPRGFGYVEFEDRDSLIDALSITDCTLKSRRIRIELATNSENERRRGGGRSDNNRDRPDRPEVSSGDWRSGPRAEPTESERSERSRVGFSRDRDDKGDKGSSGSWRDNSDRPSFRDSDNRNFSRDSDNRSFSRDSDRRFGGDRDGDRRGLNRRGDREELTRGNKDDLPSETRTRTKLVLTPRTIPENLETVKIPPPVAVPVPSASIFGNAKPVDTSLREREIESRLAKQLEKPAADSSREIRRDAWGKRNEEDGRGRRSPQRRSSLDRSPNRFDKDRRRNSLEQRGSPIRRNRSPAYRKNSPSRRSPDNRRRSPESKWRSPNRRRSPDRRYSPNRRSSPDRKYSPDRRYSPDKKYSSDRSSSPDYNRRSSPRRSYSPDSNQSPDTRMSPVRRKSSLEHKGRGKSPEHRRSPEYRRKSPLRDQTSPELRRRTPERKKYSPDRSRASNQRKLSDEKDTKRNSTKIDKTPQKNDKDKHRKEDKSTRDNHDREMPKLKEPELPNFAASNKFASLGADDSE